MEIKTIVWMISCLHLKSKLKMDKSYLLNVKTVSRETPSSVNINITQDVLTIFDIMTLKFLGAVKSHPPNYFQMSGKNIEPADRSGMTSGVVRCLMK